MKKRCKYSVALTIAAILLCLTITAWSGDVNTPEPNALIDNLHSTAPEKSTEPNIPEDSQDLTTPSNVPEPNTPAELLRLIAEMENLEPNIPEDVSEPIRPDSGRDQSYPADSWSNYRIVVQRNMFSRQRGPLNSRRRTQRTVATLPPPPEPESYIVLKGIVQENGQFIAFLEDTQNGQIFRVSEGDSIVRGKIKSLTLDSLEYEFEDRTTVVTMGFNLQGGRESETLTGMYDLTQAYPSTSEEGTTHSTAPPTEDEAEILRQLMERRKQQEGQ